MYMRIMKRWLTIIAGMCVVIVGIILMPVPGPGGIPVTLAGLAMLSTELAWAKRLLERVKRFLESHQTLRSNRWFQAGVVTGAVSFCALTSFIAFRIFSS